MVFLSAALFQPGIFSDLAQLGVQAAAPLESVNM